jgi:hypothetical protein
MGEHRRQVLDAIRRAAGPVGVSQTATGSASIRTRVGYRARPGLARRRDDAVDRLTAMLGDLDFAPELVAGGHGPPARIRLRHCPFL